MQAESLTCFTRMLCEKYLIFHCLFLLGGVGNYLYQKVGLKEAINVAPIDNFLLKGGDDCFRVNVLKFSRSYFFVVFL